MADVSYPIIHKEECKGCGRCVLGCSQNVIKIGSELNKAGYRYAYYSGEGCSGCRDCFLTCPEPLALEVYVYTKRRKTMTNQW